MRNGDEGAMKDFLVRFFDLRPQNENDYCTFLIWQMSRKLAIALVAAISICCLCILWSARPAGLYRTYRYDALSLRFATGKVRILGKSGYTAYVGDVDHGMVKGRGTLYDPQEQVVYEGEFDANAYNGTGRYYSENALLLYEGEFQDNLYNGEGRQYREDGTLWYDGNFDRGQREGDGTLYSVVQDKVYTGAFRDDQIFYPIFLGRSAAETAEIYLGQREVYTGAVRGVHMKEIGAVSFGGDGSSALDETFQVSGLYVLQQEICLAGGRCDQIPQLTEALGEAVYQGNTFLTLEDAVALNLCCEASDKEVLYGRAKIAMRSIFDDVAEVSRLEKAYQAYIYVFDKDGILYTFFCKDRDSGFDFYRIEE